MHGMPSSHLYKIPITIYKYLQNKLNTIVGNDANYEGHAKHYSGVIKTELFQTLLRKQYGFAGIRFFTNSYSYSNLKNFIHSSWRCRMQNQPTVSCIKGWNFNYYTGSAFAMKNVITFDSIQLNMASPTYRIVTILHLVSTKKNRGCYSKKTSVLPPICLLMHPWMHLGQRSKFDIKLFGVRRGTNQSGYQGR